MLLSHDLLHIHGVVTSLGPEPGLGMTSVPAPLSPGFEQAVGDFVLVPLLCAEEDPSLGHVSWPWWTRPLVLVFPVYTPAFFFGMGSLNLCQLSPPRMDVFRSVLQI